MKKKKWELKMTRRQVLKAGMIGGAGLMLPMRFLPAKALAAALPASVTLNDPVAVDKFMSPVPDALAPGFKYTPVGNSGNSRNYRVGVSQANQQWGTTGSGSNPLTTDIYGYGGTWPGKTFEVQSGRPVQIQWENNLEPDNGGHLLPVDTSLHWCYSLPGYKQYSIAANGVPIVTHVHGHHSQYRSDGNPEEFFTYRWRVTGPRFRGRTSIYHNDQPAGNLWYHDHALGITRLNVYAGLAGFYFVRDDMDTGLPGNPLNLPAWPYEKAYAIQDRMFTGKVALFYPAFPGDPAYGDFIDGEDVRTCRRHFPCIDSPTHGLGRVFRRPYGGQRHCLAQTGSGAAPLPVTPAERLRQSFPDHSLPRGSITDEHHFRWCRRSADIHCHRQRSGAGIISPGYRNAGIRTRQPL